MLRGLRGDGRTRFCADKRRNGYEFPRIGSAYWQVKAYLFLRAVEVRRRTRFCAWSRPRLPPKRTRFCERSPVLAVPVSARPSAETGTPYLHVPSPSPWPIRLFTRRNRYGRWNVSPRDIAKQSALVQVSAMKVQDSSVLGSRLDDQQLYAVF